MIFYILFVVFTILVVTVNFGLIFRAYWKHVPDEMINTDQPFVTIIIPAYNEAKVIVETIRMAYNQTYTNFNILVVDDGSTDDTHGVILDAFKLKLQNKPKPCWKFGKIHLLAPIHNDGKSAALNLGVHYAKEHFKPDYIMSVDADTLLDTNAIEIMVGKKKEGIDVVTCMIGISNGNKNLYKTSIPTSFIAKIAWLEYFKTFVIFRNSIKDLDAIVIVPGACALYSMKALEVTDGWKNNTLAEDMELTLNFHSKDMKIQYLSEFLAWTQSPNNYKDLGAQRTRWKVGLLESLAKYPHLVFQKNNKFLTWFLMPFVWLTEVATVWVELGLWIWLIISSFTIEHDWRTLIGVWIAIMLLHLTNTMLVLAFAHSKLVFDNGPTKLHRLIFPAIIEGFTYHFMFLYWGLQAQIQWIFTKKRKWEKFSRH